MAEGGRCAIETQIGPSQPVAISDLDRGHRHYDPLAGWLCRHALRLSPRGRCRCAVYCFLVSAGWIPVSISSGCQHFPERSRSLSLATDQLARHGTAVVVALQDGTGFGVT